MLLSPAPVKLRSVLQERILHFICKNNQTDYNSITIHIKRNRVTILRSLKPLIREYYVKKQEFSHDKIKNKLYFSVTEKGICYALAFLGLDIDEIIVETGQRKDIDEYVQMIRNMQNRQGGKLFLKNIADCAFREGCFGKGNLSIKNKDAFFLKSYMMTVLDISISSKGPSRPLFGENEFEKFKAIFTKEDISKFENSVKNIIKNVNSNNERLVKSLD